MDIITLGTGSCQSNPYRFNASILVEVDDALYLFDAGTPVDALICRVGKDVARLRAVFITHMHADHIGGLPVLLRAVSMAGGHVSVFLPEASAEQAMLPWMRAMRLENAFSAASFLIVSECTSIYQDALVTVGAIATDHIPAKVPVTFAYTLSAQNKRILYTGDLCADLHDYPKCATEQYFDVCLLEATHFTPETAFPLLHASQFGQLIFVHVHTPWQSDAGSIALLDAYTSLPYPVHLSHDGSVFSLQTLI